MELDQAPVLPPVGEAGAGGTNWRSELSGVSATTRRDESGGGAEAMAVILS